MSVVNAETANASDEIPMTFPQRLMEILSSEEHSDVLSWVPHGKGFIIYKKKKFSAEVLPRYFKQSKFTSFTRKLNRWGFARVTRGPERGSYFHKFFLRDQPRLCLQMSCQNARIHGGESPGAPGPLTTVDAQHHQQQLLSNMNMMPYGLGVGNGNSIMSNPNAFIQMQFQQQLQQQQQQIQNELLRRAMASQASASATQAQLLNGVNGSTNSTLGADGKNNDELLYMQMLAQNKASSMSAQPLMRAMQNSLFPLQPNNLGGENGGMSSKNQGQQESARVIPRTSSAA